MIISTQQYKQLILDLFRSKKEAVTLDLITRIDTHLTLETCHFYRRGKFLFTLDQVVDAIMAGELDNESIPPVTAEQVKAANRRVPGQFYPRRKKSRIIMTDRPANISPYRAN